MEKGCEINFLNKKGGKVMNKSFISFKIHVP